MIGFFEIRNSSEGFVKAILVFVSFFFLEFFLLGFFRARNGGKSRPCCKNYWSISATFGEDRSWIFFQVGMNSISSKHILISVHSRKLTRSPLKNSDDSFLLGPGTYFLGQTVSFRED